MPPKSRKHRRNIPSGRGPMTAPQSRPASEAPAAAASAPAPVRTGYAASATKTAPAVFSAPHILSELKWISLVTVFIVIVLILTYAFIPK